MLSDLSRDLAADYADDADLQQIYPELSASIRFFCVICGQNIRLSTNLGSFRPRRTDAGGVECYRVVSDLL